MSCRQETLNILLINGSPRSNGNGNLLLEKALTGIKENCSKSLQVKEILPSKLDINPCIACSYCFEHRNCIYQDDMVQVIKNFDQADIILIATPVFFNGVPAQLKIMIDRCQVIWASKYVLNNSLIDRNKKRTAYLFITAGEVFYQDQFTAVRQVVKMFFRVINTVYIGDLVVSDLDNNPVKGRKDIMDKAYKIGVDMSSYC